MQPGQSVLFLSFSRAAVARIRDAAKFETTAAERELLSIQTFHPFYWSILKTHAHLLGAPATLAISLPQDQTPQSGAPDAVDPDLSFVLLEHPQDTCLSAGCTSQAVDVAATGREGSIGWDRR